MKDKKVRFLVIASVFTALTFFLAISQYGIIPLGFINVTIMCIPVIIGTLLMGLKMGLVLGAAFGLASTLRAFGVAGTPSTLVANLMAINPLLVIIMSMVPRLLIPVVAHLVFNLLNRGEDKHKPLAIGVATAAGSFTNTIFYLGLMLLFYVINGLDTAKIIGLITGTGAIAGSLEAAAAVIISIPAVRRASKAFKKD